MVARCSRKRYSAHTQTYSPRNSPSLHTPNQKLITPRTNRLLAQKLTQHTHTKVTRSENCSARTHQSYLPRNSSPSAHTSSLAMSTHTLYKKLIAQRAHKVTLPETYHPARTQSYSPRNSSPSMHTPKLLAQKLTPRAHKVKRSETIILLKLW